MIAPIEHSGGAGRTAAIRGLNDALRRTFSNGNVMLSQGVAALPPPERTALLLAVRQYDAFDLGDDPYGEHDFGTSEQAGRTYFWKIDYYDNDLLHVSPDPANPAVTCRVLTVMRAGEY